MTMTPLENMGLLFYIDSVPQIGFVWCFPIIRLRLYAFGGRNIRQVILCPSQFIVSGRYMMLICLITSDINFYTYILKCHSLHFSSHWSQNICLWQSLRRKVNPQKNYLNFTDLFICSSHYIRPLTLHLGKLSSRDSWGF